MVFKEAIRLYPPIPTYARQSTVPVELGGYALPANSIIIISPHIFQNDERWWDAPTEFRPERFTKDNEKSQTKAL
jgi:cytochrome P450